MKTLTTNKRAWLIGLEVAVPLILLAIWWIWSTQTQQAFFPPLPAILERFQDLWLFDHFISDVIPSVGNLVLGFLIAAIIGTALGILFALVRPVSDLLYPLVNFYRAVPSVAIIPVFIALLGFGNEVKLLIIVLAALPPTLISTLDGVRSVEPMIKDVARVYRLTAIEKLFGVYLPAASPQIFSGFQVSLQFSFVAMIASEMLGSTEGIGAMTLLAQQTFTSTDMWAGVILLGIIGYLANLILNIIRNNTLRWYDDAKAKEKTF